MMRFLNLGLVLLVAVAFFAGGCGEKPKPALFVAVEQSGNNLVIRMKTTNFTIGRDGHAHVRLDGGPEAMPGTTTYIIPDVSPGKHVVDVELSDPDHKPLGIRQSTEVEIN